MPTYLTHSIVDEVRVCLNAVGTGSTTTQELINDEQIRRFIFKHSSMQNLYQFQKYTDGLWVNETFDTTFYWNMMFSGTSENIYRLNCTGSIETPESYSKVIDSIINSPVDSFNILGDFTQHFPTAASLFVVGAPDVNGEIQTITIEGTYTVSSSSYDGTYTTIIVDENIPDTDPQGGYIIFAPINTDTRTLIGVTTMEVQFNEVMHDILFYIATAHSREKLADLLGNITNPYENLVSQARRWRGIWTV